MIQYYKIANLIVKMDSFGKTEEQARAYLLKDTQCDPSVDIEIRSNPLTMKAQHPHLTMESCEYLSSGNSFYRQLLDFDGMLIHASAVAMDGKAYLFSAPCGTGKSTHAALWQQVFGKERALILNDDKPAVRLEDGVFYAYGTPWSGKSDLNLNMRVPLGGICMLKRGSENRIMPFGGAKAVHGLLEQTARSKDPVFMEKLLNLFEKLFEKVPMWQMECNISPDAALLSHDVMSGEKQRNR